MHISAFLHLRQALKKHVSNDPILASRGKLSVVDIGSADINGSSRELFAALGCTYQGVDLEPGPGVDVVLDDPYALPFDDDSFDIAVSSQTFEHSEYFWKVFSEMARVTNEHGVIIVLTPSAGPVHRYPVDCYRFNSDSMAGLARHADVVLVEVLTSDFGPFHDTVAVFRKCRDGDHAHIGEPDLSLRLDQPTQNTFPPGVPDEVEHGAGSGPSYDLLSMIHDVLEPRQYAEIGVEYGNSLVRAKCPSLGIDPAPQLTVELEPRHQLCQTTSDDFFWITDHPGRVRDLDLAYVDGMHQIEFALRDFMYMERLANRTSVIVIDDIYPAHPLQGERIRQSRYWTGDVWKIINILRSVRPDLVLMPMNTSPTGSLIVIGCNPEDRRLWNSFDIVIDWAIKDGSPTPPEIVDRRDSFEPDDPLLPRVLRLLKESRSHESSGDTIERIRSLVHGSHPRRITTR